MMGHRDGQMQIVILNIRELIPNNHLPREIEELVSFDFIYMI